MQAAVSASRAAAPIVAQRVRRNAMAVRPVATAGRRTAVATRRAVALNVKCSAPHARAAARRPRCHSSPAAISRSIARRVSSSVVEAMTGPAEVDTRVGVATRWRAANSGDPSDNRVNARRTEPENKLPWRLVPGDYSPGTTNARYSRWLMTCVCCAMRRTATRTSNPRPTRCGRIVGLPASSPKLRRR